MACDNSAVSPLLAASNMRCANSTVSGGSVPPFAAAYSQESVVARDCPPQKTRPTISKVFVVW